MEFFSTGSAALTHGLETKKKSGDERTHEEKTVGTRALFSILCGRDRELLFSKGRKIRSNKEKQHAGLSSNALWVAGTPLMKRSGGWRERGVILGLISSAWAKGLSA